MRENGADKKFANGFYHKRAGLEWVVAAKLRTANANA
jgi:hypothetical protein